MKNSSLLKTSLRLLVIAGALTPLATLGANSTVAAYQEGGIYDDLRHIQSSQDMTESLPGAQGPVRTDFIEPSWSSDEGAFYDNLRNTQETSQPMETMRGAQGPVRSDFLTPTWRSDESSFYDNLTIHTN